MFGEKIKKLLREIDEANAQITAKRSEARGLLDAEDVSEENLKRAKGLTTEIDQLKEQIRSKQETLSTYKALQAGDGKPTGKRDGESEMGEEVREFNNYLHRDAGLVSADVKPVIPEEILYNPENEVKTVTDLSKLVTQFQASTASGSYPVKKHATARLNTVAELEQNPALAKPAFIDVDWRVQTYRGAILLSQESIDDSAIDLTGLVARDAQEQKINTTNYSIAEVLKTFTAKNVTGPSVDDIKHILNVDLDPAYNKVIVASQSFYQYLDTLKDGNGQYLLHEAITEGSPSTLLGVPIVQIGDDLFGAAGEAHAFIGDLSKGVLYANRKDIQVQWVRSEVYGQYLQEVIRYDVKKADSNAGFFVTYTPASK